MSDVTMPGRDHGRSFWRRPLVWILVAGLALVAVALIIGTSGGDSPSASARQTSLPAGLTMEPGPMARGAFVRDLDKIDPDIVHGKIDRAVDRGRDACSKVAERPRDQQWLVQQVQRRYTSPQHPNGFDEATAAKILTAVRTYLCPGV